MKRSVSKNHRSTTAKITAELNRHYTIPLPNITVLGDLYKSRYHWKTTISKTLHSSIDIDKWGSVVRLSEVVSGWMVIVWWILSTFPTSNWIYICRQSKESFSLDCLVSIVKHKGDILGAIPQNSLNRLLVFCGRDNANDYLSVLATHVHPIVQHHCSLTVAYTFKKTMNHSHG